MVTRFEGELKVDGGRYALVVARYNRSITDRLAEAAIETLVANGVETDAIDLAYVPGAWEISLVADRLARTGRYDAVLCLGAVIRGETTHDQHINRQVSLSLGQTGVETGIPVLFGVLTCNTLEQALNRAGGTVGNKGVECAEAALQMVNLLKQLPVPPSGVRAGAS